MPNDIGIIAPNGKTFTEDQVRGWIQQALSKKITRFIRAEVPTSLLSDHHRSALNEVGYAVKGTDPSGAKVFILNNGVKVIMDTLASNKGKFHWHGFSPNGASRFPKEDYFSAVNAPSIIQNAGVGKLDKFQLARFIEEKSNRLWIKPYVDYRETGIRGNAAIEDLEKMLQLVYLYFTYPNMNNKAFNNWQIQEKNRHLYPSYDIIIADFNVMIRAFLGDSSQAPQGTKRLQGISETEMHAAYRIYRELYSDAADFTFIISGSFSEGEVLHLLQKYLGNLPGSIVTASSPPVKNKVEDFPKGPFNKRFFTQEIGANYRMKS